MSPEFKISRGGFVAAGLFLLAVVAGIAWVFFVASKNPADSGESAIFLIFFAMPWIGWLPSNSVGPWSALGCVLLNAFILYCVFGGLRLARSAE